MRNRSGALFLLLLLIITSAALAKRHRHKLDDEGNTNANFDYYLLSLSWAPNYCSSHPNDHSSECQPGNHKAFVLHGLWPQAENGPPPRQCGPVRPVAHEVVDHMLEYMPSRGLVQHEWAEHGTCSGLSSRDYFAQAEQAFRNLHMPGDMESLNQQKDFAVEQLESRFAQSNHAPREAFRISCYGGELVAVEACLDKALHFRPCSGSVRECRSSQVRVEAIR